MNKNERQTAFYEELLALSYVDPTIRQCFQHMESGRMSRLDVASMSALVLRKVIEHQQQEIVRLTTKPPKRKWWERVLLFLADHAWKWEERIVFAFLFALALTWLAKK